MAGLSIALLLSLLGQNSASPHSILVPGGPSTRFVRETMATAVDPAGRMTVMTKINGQGPYPFTIDTGANRSVISDRLAQELGLAVLPASSLGSTGFLGTDMLQGRNVVLDFKRHRIILTRFEGLAAVGATDGETITVDARRRLGQLVLTDASVGGVKVVAIIDTGAENTIGNPALRKLLMGTKPSGPTGQLIGVTGKWIPGEAGYVPKIRIGKMSMGNMPIVFADPHTFRLFKLENTPAILVGMDVLRMFDQVAIDFSRQEVRFNISQSWNPRTLQALNRPKTEGTDNGSARLLARADPAGAGVDTGGNLFRH